MLPENFLLSLVAAAATSPISLREVKDQLRITEDDDDILLIRTVSSACSMVEQMSGYAVSDQTWRISAQNLRGERFYLPRYPVTSIVSIDYFDVNDAAQSLNVGDFTLYDDGSDAWLEPSSGNAWPQTARRPDALSVTFTVGGALARHPSLRQAILMVAAEWFEQPTASTDVKRKEIPFGAMHLINLNRRSWIGE